MTHDQHQLSLFSGPPHPGAGARAGAGASAGKKLEGIQSRTLVLNPHLLAARRIAKRMRRLPDRSDAETRAGLAICAQLKAFLADETDTSPNSPTAVPPARH